MSTLALKKQLITILTFFSVFLTTLPNAKAQTRELVQEEGSEKRIALIIGNGKYRKASPLANPVNDANDMAAALGKLGFEVISGTDTNLVQMRRLIREFGEKLERQKGIGLFYFAGHGVEVRGRNYLIPIDADISREVETEDYAIEVNSILRQMEAANNGFNIVILDACRNNPFARGWNGSGDTGGLANVNSADRNLYRVCRRARNDSFGRQRNAQRAFYGCAAQKSETPESEIGRGL